MLVFVPSQVAVVVMKESGLHVGPWSPCWTLVHQVTDRTSCVVCVSLLYRKWPWLVCSQGH